MTAAYTDDPTIAQEQKQEKRNSTGVRRRSGSGSEDNEDAVPKVATGGQDKEEVDAEHEGPAALSTSLEATVTEKKDPRVHEASESTGRAELEKGQSTSGTSIHETTREIDPTIEGRAEMVSMDLELDPTKPVFRDSGTPSELHESTEEEDCRDSDADARGSDSLYSKLNDSDSTVETNDPPKIKLLEIRNSLEAIEVEEKEASQDRSEVRKSVETSFEGIGIVEESYDPESELDFHEAVRAGDAKCVAALLANGRVQNLDEPDWNVSGDPPLLVAATNHCLPVLSLLLANGCDPAVRSPRGETALHRVILNGGPGNVFRFVDELLRYGCPPGVKEAGGGLTALHVLTRQLAHAQGSKNLHHHFEAALKTLALLAQAGPVDAKDHQGRSALHILASSTIFDNNHRTEIELLIETLLSAGADTSLKNDRGESPLHECLECGALNTAFLLVPHTPTGVTSRYGETPLHIASRKNYVDMVAKLLERGEDPSLQDAGGNTPLHLASARGFHQTVSLLVTSPLAQLEKFNIDGLTALQVAAESGFVNAVRLLLKAGADPSQTIHYCTTSLHRHPDISVLIDHEMTRRRQLAA